MAINRGEEIVIYRTRTDGVPHWRATVLGSVRATVAGESEGLMFDKITCATDGSEHADRALDYACQLAKSEGASLDVIHIIEKFGGARAAGLDQRADQPELDDKIKRQVAELGAKGGVDTHLHLESTLGSTAKRIAEISRDADADVIVVGTRGHSSVAGALLGSVTQQLLHVADCPVLAVPPLAQSRPGALEATS